MDVNSSDAALSEVLLETLADRDSFDSYKLSQELGKDHQRVVGAIKSLQSIGNVSGQVSSYLVADIMLL